MTQPGLDGLGSIGIGPAEEAAYEFLLGRPEASAAELAREWDRPEPLDGLLARLAAAGLILPVPGPAGRYVVAPPHAALQALVLAEEQRLRAARLHAKRLAELHRDQAVAAERTLIEVVTGHRTLRQRIDTLVHGAREQVRWMDKAACDGRGTPTLLDPAEVPDEVSVRTLRDPAAVEHARTGHAGTGRVLPAIPMSTLIIDDSCAVLPLSGGADATGAAVLVHGSALLYALTDLFEGMWQRAFPLDRPRPGGPATRGRAVPLDQQRLVALLLSGLTEQAIARQLGVGARTVQRRVAELVEDLGVRTRFQAGVKAALREATEVGPSGPPDVEAGPSGPPDVEAGSSAPR